MNKDELESIYRDIKEIKIQGATNIAKAAVEAAKQEVGEAASIADASASSTKPVDAGKPVRENLEKARVAITAAHKVYVYLFVPLYIKG